VEELLIMFLFLKIAAATRRSFAYANPLSAVANIILSYIYVICKHIFTVKVLQNAQNSILHLK